MATIPTCHPDRKHEAFKLCRSCYNIRKRDPQYHYETEKYGHIRRNYGLSKEAYDALVEQQQGCCAICKRHVKRLVVDHDWKTKRVRGLLCVRCNGLIGRAEDDVQWLHRVLDYLTYTEPN